MVDEKRIQSRIEWFFTTVIYDGSERRANAGPDRYQFKKTEVISLKLFILCIIVIVISYRNSRDE